MKKILLLVCLLVIVLNACDEPKYCALTFDDGPNAELTPLVLEKLNKHHIKASFFMIGQLVNESTQPVVKRMVENGYELHNHSWAWDSLDAMSEEKITKSVNDTVDAIRTITNAVYHKKHKNSPDYIDRYTMFFRPPNLAVSQIMYDTINMPFASGVLAYDWDPQWGGVPTAEERANNVLNDPNMRDGAIILMHDVQPLPHPTPEALDIIVPELKKRGFVFVTLSELFKIKGIDPASNGDNLWVVVE